MKIKLPGGKKIKIKWDQHVPIIAVISLILIVGTAFSYNKISTLQEIVLKLSQEKDENLKELEKISAELDELKNQDQIKRNEDLQKTIKNIETTYDKAVAVYDDLVEFRTKSKDTGAMEEDFAEALAKLSDRDYSGGN